MKVAVFGNIFVDYKGWVKSNYDPLGRNQGQIEILHGGVARNVAENMSCLGMPVELVTTLPNDTISQMLSERLIKNNVGLKYSLNVDSNAIGTWLAILDKQGELLASVTQLPDIQQLESLILSKIDDIAADVSCVAMDIDLTPRIADCIISACKKNNLKFYALPGNLTVISLNPYLFSHMECFICNDIEAGKILNKVINPKDIRGLQAISQYFCRQFKLKQLVITTGEYGAVYCDAEGRTGHQPIYPVRVQDTTGAGDAFFSATTAALINGKCLAEAVDAGARLAAIIISSKENTCHELSNEQLKKLLV